MQTSNIDRRTVLRTMGAASVAGSGLIVTTGLASAHGFNKVRFCGCTQVCVCGFGNIEVIVTRESDGECETVDMGGGSPNNFCFELDDCLPLLFECDKIIAVRAFGDDEDVVVCNPNTCAEKALAACDIDCDRFGETSDAGPCGDKFLAEECD